MHEMSIAMNIVELASAAAHDEGAQTINSIELDIGLLSGVMVESLEFCFEAASRSTPAQGAKLSINTIPGQGKCMACDIEFPVKTFTDQCPQCQRFLLNISQGKDLRIRAITIAD